MKRITAEDICFSESSRRLRWGGYVIPERSLQTMVILLQEHGTIIWLTAQLSAPIPIFLVAMSIAHVFQALLLYISEKHEHNRNSSFSKSASSLLIAA